MKTFVIIHGWGGTPTIGWFKWLKFELEKKGHIVIVPIMPNPAVPKIKPWVNKIASILKNTQGEIVLIGHSIGCQAIIRYLETDKAKNVDKIILVAPWLNLTGAVTDDLEDYNIAKEWLETKIDFKKAKSKMKKSIGIFSTNDPFVEVKEADKFKKALNSEVIIEKNKSHYEEGKTGKIPVLLKKSLEK
jgi:uncharacterized protein